MAINLEDSFCRWHQTEWNVSNDARISLLLSSKLVTRIGAKQSKIIYFFRTYCLHMCSLSYTNYCRTQNSIFCFKMVFFGSSWWRWYERCRSDPLMLLRSFYLSVGLNYDYFTRKKGDKYGTAHWVQALLFFNSQCGTCWKNSGILFNKWWR